jgi:hypothetical protein
MKHSKKLIAITVALGAVGAATPALAEGKWTSFMSNVPVGFESREWADRNLDDVPTTVKLSGCSVSGTQFSSTTITLYQDTIFPLFFTNHGQINNYCNSVSWGQALGAGNYHFTVEKINGSATTTRKLSASTVVTGY